MFTDEFPPAIYPAILITFVVALRLRNFYRRRDWLQFGRSLPEMLLAGIYFIEAFYPFTALTRSILIRNTIMLIFSVELWYQLFVLPRMRKLVDGTK